jgi:uncharacterized Fe-S cluster protein YjdI/CDGSH-type Zn-finger protein
MTRRVYRGKNVEVSFDFDVCIHVGACLAGLPGVFELHRRPWIDPDNAAPDAVARVVESCPSGALQYRRLDGSADENPPSPTQITPLRNGPLLVHGPVEVTHGDGTIEAFPRATLCRCGLSKNKPFCDNSHLAADFTAAGGRIHIPPTPLRPHVDQPISRNADPRRRDQMDAVSGPR